MKYPILYRISSGLLAAGFVGHTFGGMLKTARRGPEAGPEADRVMSQMRAVHFTWRGANSNWFDWWMGNGLSVSSLLLLAIVVLWDLGGEESGRRMPPSVAWGAFTSLALLTVFGFQYFGTRIGAAFAVTALLTGSAVVMSTFGARAHRTP
jgi:hypothetical protein